MGFWRNFIRRVNAANTYQAQLIGNQMMATRQAELEQQHIEITRQRKWINNASAYHRCRIGRITLKAPK